MVGCENPQAPMSCGPIPQQTVNTGESTTVSVCFNDANGDALRYSASSSNPSVVTAAVSGVEVTVTGVAPGSATVTVTATDPGSLQATVVMSVMVPNRAPRAVGTIEPLTVIGGETETVDVSGNFMEPDGETLSYSASSSNPDIATTSASGSAITVTAVAQGMATITVTATDPGGEAATQSFEVTVPNRAPEPAESIPAATVHAGETSSVDLVSHFTDPDGDALEYTASSGDMAVATVSVAGTVATVTAVAPGTTMVTATATDPGGESAAQSFQVTVPNRGPAAVGTIPAQMLTEGDSHPLELGSYFTDPDGEVLTYTAANGNPAVAVGTVSAGVLTIRAVGAGFAAITVTARDPGGLTAIQTVTVEVAARNRAPQPQGAIPAQSITVGLTVTVGLAAYFTDPDGDALTYAAASQNPAVAAAASSATLSITGRSQGSTTVTVTATDPGGLTATQSVSVTVGTAAAPDLLFSGVEPSAITVAPGEFKIVTFTIRNAGNANSDPTNARAYQSQDATITTSDRVVSDPFPIAALVPNGEIEFRLRLSIPENFQPGTFHAGMCVDPVTGEANTGNNCSSAVAVTVASPQPDLAVPRVVPDSVVVDSAGAGKTVVFTVANAGEAAASQTTARFYDSDDDVITTDDTQVGGPVTIRQLAAGGVQNVTHDVTSSDTAGTTHWTGMCVVALSDETVQNNNCSPAVEVGVVRAGGADLVVSEAAPRVITIAVGEVKEVVFSIRNVGDAATIRPTNADVLRSTDNTISASDTRLTTESVRPLDPLEEWELVYDVAGAGNPGTVYYLGVCMDATGSNGEPAGARMNNCSRGGGVATIVISSSSSQQSAREQQPEQGQTAEPADRRRGNRVSRPGPFEHRPLPLGRITITVESVEVRNPKVL